MASDERASGCAVCGKQGHSHDDHWLIQEARARGLHVVTAADKAVLDAMAGLETVMLEYVRAGWSAAPPVFHPACRAELARREASR